MSLKRKVKVMSCEFVGNGNKWLFVAIFFIFCFPVIGYLVVRSIPFGECEPGQFSPSSFLVKHGSIHARYVSVVEPEWVVPCNGNCEELFWLCYNQKFLPYFEFDDCVYRTPKFNADFSHGCVVCSNPRKSVCIKERNFFIDLRKVRIVLNRDKNEWIALS